MCNDIYGKQNKSQKKQHLSDFYTVPSYYYFTCFLNVTNQIRSKFVSGVLQDQKKVLSKNTIPI